MSTESCKTLMAANNNGVTPTYISSPCRRYGWVQTYTKHVGLEKNAEKLDQTIVKLCDLILKACGV